MRIDSVTLLSRAPQRASHRLFLLSSFSVVSLLNTSPLFALDTMDNASKNEQAAIFVIGSRVAGRTESDVPVPIDIIGNAELRATGHTEVGRMLQATIPSFNFSSSSVSDGSDAVRPATLRGLGPDQTLVLVNGKRRHQGALIHINLSVGRGTSGVDINAIPIDAIDRVEVLRDGAAAQYGSDAIAGVINIVLKDGSEPGSANISYGQYIEGDGATVNLGISKGVELENGFVNFTYNYRHRDATNRAGLSAQCQYVCTDHPTLAGVKVSNDPREKSFNRLNFSVGDSESEHHSVVISGGLDIGNDELYGFATLSMRDNQSAGFYRRANQTDNNPVLSDGLAYYPDGYLPLINTNNNDYSVSVGYKMELSSGLQLDLSASTGGNSQEYIVNNSVNSSWVTAQGSDAQLRGQAQTSANAGQLNLGLTTLNLDMNWEGDSASYAWGGEARHDSYQMEAGEEYSWQDYDGIATSGNGSIQVFPGFTPMNVVNESRAVYSLYVDSEWDISDDILLTGAVRYDNFDGFGDTTNFKLSSRYNISDNLIVRGAVSTGFRAPSMQQQYFNNISTQFIDGQAVQVGTFRNDSQLALDVGIPALKEEQSTNYSVGLTFEPADNFTLTVDYYGIHIDDRIVISDKISSGLGSVVFDSALAKNNVTGAQFFINGANTETEGVDIVATYSTSMWQGDLLMSVALNKTTTDITQQFSPGGLNGISPQDVFGAQGISIIETWQPKDRINLTTNYTANNVSYNLSMNRFGEYTVLDGGERQTYSAKWLTDLKVNWHISQAVSLSIGVNNLFDVTPDKNLIGQAGQGHIVDEDNNTLIASQGVFKYSRRSAPFGFNGAYLYAEMSYRF